MDEHKERKPYDTDFSEQSGRSLSHSSLDASLEVDRARRRFARWSTQSSTSCELGALGATCPMIFLPRGRSTIISPNGVATGR